MAVFGIDISRYQRGIDLAQAMAEGVEFAILKIGGSDAGRYKDSCFDQHYANAKGLGLPVGAYYFGQDMSVEEAMKSADHLIGLLAGYQFEYPIYYDVEAKMLTLDRNRLTAVVLAFCQKVEAAGFFVGVYSSSSSFNSEVDDKVLSRFCHWVACWGKSKPKVPSGSFGLWQFGGETNKLRSNKVAGLVCDQDYCYVDYPSVIKEKGLNGFTVVDTGAAKPDVSDNGGNTGVSLAAGTVMSARQYVDTLFHIVDCPTVYNNHYPYNLGYWDGRRFSFDCWNLVKAVINGWRDVRTVGYYVKDLSITGDIDGATILSKCSLKSRDFSNLNIPGAYLYMSGHAGSFVGEHVVGGKTYNVIECTGAWGRRVLRSWVDADGTRRQYKGGPINSHWTDWGLLCWVDYGEAVQTCFFYKGLDYSPVFDPVFYDNKYRDLHAAFGGNAVSLFQHFTTYGMKERRQAKVDFDVVAYASRYNDLRQAFGENWPAYYEHYCRFGIAEGRNGKP